MGFFGRNKINACENCGTSSGGLLSYAAWRCNKCGRQYCAQCRNTKPGLFSSDIACPHCGSTKKTHVGTV
ncbi:hypothetical protein BXY64_0146 [Marinifilum flexuosum]|uniref:Uncharacterized protein n=1 Tax=Marinifilum flexuosum TaxID=1117708 RepID=A0A419X637_9BACT|nr:hypothetical protein BXY64_0146 [Marinifilum flexuosum]